MPDALTPEQRERKRAKRRAFRARRKAQGNPVKKPPPYDLQTLDTLRERARRLKAGGWPISKWILFCVDCINLGLVVGVYEAKTTRSKYVYVLDAARSQRFKVRFSNHRPNPGVQEKADSDFYVGVSNGTVTTTDDALAEVRWRFNLEEKTA